MEPGSQLRDGRYRVVRQLGEGAQATTYEAVDAREGRLVAVKRFIVRGASSWKEVELAEREAHVLRSLQHELVPRFVENFEEDGALYLVTDIVEGESLAALLKRGQRFGRADVVKLVSDLSDATSYLHGRAPPVIHRDIKPANVVLRKDGRHCLVDFGAVRAKLAKSGGSTVVGTFGFMAPEQFQGRAMPQSDVYAIGATALSLLTGREPEELPHRGLQIDVRASLGPTADEPLVQALSSMLEPDPDRRPAKLDGILKTLGRPGAERPPSGKGPGGSPFGSGGGSPFGPGRGPFSRDGRNQGPFGPRPFARPRRPRGGRDAELGPPTAVSRIVLGVARTAVFLAVVVFVPLLLATLSLVFGKPLRVAAAKVRDAGHRAIRRIDRVQAEEMDRVARVRAGVRVDSTDPNAPHVRVADVDGDHDAAAEAEAAEEERREAESRASRGSRRR
ncbi:MAG: serine/threonine protein kinase [Polyangiaceae bacterium]|nr:serine/threonine protein kinase [Polyangiaceae bacterium]